MSHSSQACGAHLCVASCHHKGHLPESGVSRAQHLHFHLGHLRLLLPESELAAVTAPLAALVSPGPCAYAASMGQQGLVCFLRQSSRDLSATISSAYNQVLSAQE